MFRVGDIIVARPEPHRSPYSRTQGSAVMEVVEIVPLVRRVMGDDATDANIRVKIIGPPTDTDTIYGVASKHFKLKEKR